MVTGLQEIFLTRLFHDITNYDSSLIDCSLDSKRDHSVKDREQN